jgi:hypothetical protein
VREYIEQRERDFARGMEDLDLAEEVAVVEAMYENVRKDVEANTPDSYVSIGGRRDEMGSVQPLPSLARNKARKVEELERQAERAKSVVAEGKSGVWLEDAERLVEERVKRAMGQKVEEVREGVRGVVEKKADEIQRGVRGAEEKMVSEVVAKEKDTEDRLREIAEKAAEKVLEFARKQ